MLLGCFLCLCAVSSFFFFVFCLLFPFYHSTRKWLPLVIFDMCALCCFFGAVAAVVAVIVVTIWSKKNLVIFLGLVSIYVFILRIKRSFIVVVFVVVCAPFALCFSFIRSKFYFGETNTSPIRCVCMWAVWFGACKLLRSIGMYNFAMLLLPFQSTAACVCVACVCASLFCLFSFTLELCSIYFILTFDRCKSC